MSDLHNIEFLYKTYFKRLHRIALQIVSDAALAEDVVQEVFIHVWKKRDEIEITNTLEGYLTRSTINRSLNYLEKIKRHLTIEIEDKHMQQGIDFQAASSTYDHEVLQDLIQKALDKLPPKCKAIFVLSRFENMKNKEIAEQLGISIKTVENQMTIALKILNQELKPKLNNQFPGLLFILQNFF